MVIGDCSLAGTCCTREQRPFCCDEIVFQVWIDEIQASVWVIVKRRNSLSGGSLSGSTQRISCVASLRPLEELITEGCHPHNGLRAGAAAHAL
jgi:hypothetical protein